MKRWDLIVIGTGLAGLTAARTAVEMGARVLVVGRGMGSLTLFGNTIDVLGAIPPGVDLETGVTHWIAAHPDHPYARTGWAGIAEALIGFHDLFPPPYSFVAAGMRNSLVPTGAGTLRPTYLLPVTMRAGAGITAEETLIVGFRGFKDFQGDTVSLHLKCRGVNISLPRYGLEGLSAFALARLMDEVPFRNGLGEAIRGQKAGEKRIGLPAVLGLLCCALVSGRAESADLRFVLRVQLIGFREIVGAEAQRVLIADRNPDVNIGSKVRRIAARQEIDAELRPAYPEARSAAGTGPTRGDGPARPGDSRRGRRRPRCGPPRRRRGRGCPGAARRTRAPAG